MKNALCILVATAVTCGSLASAAADGFKPLFNGKDLAGWDGNPELWSVQNGCITGSTTPASIPYNQFLIWRGGRLKNFELRATIKQTGNNSGIQYRSRELEEIGLWAVGGYQCDVHPAPVSNGMLYEEKGRGFIAQNGQTLIVDPHGDRWLVEQREPVVSNADDWNEYTVIAQGNKIIQKVNGQMTVEIVDHQADKRTLEGLLAFQIHRGPPMKVQIKDVLLKELPDGGVLTQGLAPVPESAKKLEAPKSTATKAAKKN